MSSGKRSRKGGNGSGTEDARLSDAASKLESEIMRFEKLTTVALQTALDSEKQIEHVAETIDTAAASHAQFAEHMRALIEAVSAARDRQQASAEALNARGEEVGARRAEHRALAERFSALAAEAKDIRGAIQAAASPDSASVLQQVASATERLDGVIERARELGVESRTRGLVDLERQADAIRQQVLSARNKLHQLKESLASRS
jgi:hypothetical protein